MLKHIDQLLATRWYAAWALLHRIDANKIKLEREGVRRPPSGDVVARVIIDAIRLGQGISPSQVGALADVDNLLASKWYRVWAALHVVDVHKIALERAGVRRPDPGDAFAKVVVDVIRLSLAAPPPPPPKRAPSLFDGLWAFARGPHSGSETEKLQALRAAGYQAVFFNIGDHASDEWEAWESLAGQAGLVWGYWARCYTRADIARLVQATEGRRRPAVIVNLEQNAGDPRWTLTGTDVAAELAALDLSCQIGVSTEPFMPENFNWLPLIEMGCVDLPQTSVLEFPDMPPSAAVARAEQFGWKQPVPSLATYAVNGIDPVRSMYGRSKPFGIYTVDDCSVAEIATWV